MAHSRVYVFNNANISEYDVSQQVKIADYVEEIERKDEEFTRSINWFRETFNLEKNGNSELSDEEKNKILQQLEKTILDRLTEIRNLIDDAINSLEFAELLCRLDNIDYEYFRYVINDCDVSNSLGLYSALRVNNEKLIITSIYDYHF